jgi:hypothetical protein
MGSDSYSDDCAATLIVFDLLKNEIAFTQFSAGKPKLDPIPIKALWLIENYLRKISFD